MPRTFGRECYQLVRQRQEISEIKMRTRWEWFASAVVVLVMVVSNREATARNQTVEQKIRDDPELSEVRKQQHKNMTIICYVNIIS